MRIVTYILQNAFWVTVHSVHSNALRDAQKDEPSCDKHKK